MEKERPDLMLEAIKMNEKYHTQLLKDIAFHIMTNIYPEYEAASNKIFYQDFGLGRPRDPAVAKDYKTENVALQFVDKLVKLGSLGAIKKYCQEKGLQEYYPNNESEYIEFTYKEMLKPN